MFKRSNRKYKTITEVLYTYDNILLTTYMEIAQTGNTGLLVVTGSPSDKQIQERWETIVKRNSEHNGFNLNEYQDNLKEYARLLADYELVKLTLLQICMVVDDDAELFLQSKGYRIDRSSASAYNESIQLALQRCKNILTKLKTRYNQIQQASKDNENQKAQTSIEAILANISAWLGFSVGSDITLARYNEYKKIIKRKHEASKMKKAA